MTHEWPKLGEDVAAVLVSNGTAVIVVFCNDYKVAGGREGFHGDGTNQLVKFIGEDPQLGRSGPGSRRPRGHHGYDWPPSH